MAKNTYECELIRTLTQATRIKVEAEDEDDAEALSAERGWELPDSAWTSDSIEDIEAVDVTCLDDEPEEDV